MDIYSSSSAWHVFSAFIIFLLGGLISIYLGKKLKTTANRSFLVYCWHTFFCLVYYYYILKFGGDSLVYYKKALLEDIQLNRLGTNAVNFITYIFVQSFNLSFLATFLLFNIFGSIGLLLFDASLKNSLNNHSKKTNYLATLIIFLPSVSFWSSAIGKDSLSFLATSLALWATLNLSKRGKLMFLAITIMLIVRPHIAGAMILALSASVIFDKTTSILKKLILSTVSIIIAFSLIPFALDYAGVGGQPDSTAIIEYIEKRQSYNMAGGGGVDISSMSLPMQIFTYLFRPLIFEARSIPSLAAALDNLILLFLFLVGGISLLKTKQLKSSVANRQFMWVYSSICLLILATTTANLGIAIRQKWMFTPFLILLFITSFKIKKNKSKYKFTHNKNNITTT